MLPPDSKYDEVSTDFPDSRLVDDPLHGPFVGNQTVADNITECVQLAIWSALSGQRSNVSVNVRDGAATLAGTVPTQERRQAIVEAVGRVKGVQRVVDRIRVARLRPLRTQFATHATAVALEQIAARPMLYVVRYCVLDDASISAAVRQAVPILESALASHGAPPMRELIVVYRNRVPGAVTVEIGVPVDLVTDAASGGEPALGRSPGGAMISAVAERGLPELLRRQADLVETACASGLEVEFFFWQQFTRDQVQVWRGHPRAKLFLPIIHVDRLVAPTAVAD